MIDDTLFGDDQGVLIIKISVHHKEESITEKIVPAPPANIDKPVEDTPRTR